MRDLDLIQVGVRNVLDRQIELDCEAFAQVGAVRQLLPTAITLPSASLTVT